MILSEFAGAAQSLNGSIVVNPWDSQEVADAIYEAVTMDAETRAENHRKLFKVRLPFPSLPHPIPSSLLLLRTNADEFRPYSPAAPPPTIQYVNKYSAAYWGTSFVREMTRIELPQQAVKPVAESPAESVPDSPAREGGAPALPRPTVEELKHGVAELRIKQEDARGSAVENGTVPLTPPQNALAPHNSA